ncbi:MAG: glycosyl hydrolase 115 family protein [Bacteroides sp.]|nr:glycosyl hydrolase 115 family protein [Bacteroides sp.]MCM1095253.1 glycosyl hydrolase 115 family protein [Terasakiella sp.]
MADKPTDDDRRERGWAQALPRHLCGPVRVENHARDGRSTKSFIDEGRWDVVRSRMKEGDYLFIQFGHNDEKESAELHTVPGESFDRNLIRFIEEAKRKGVIPVLLNPIARRNYPPSPDSPIQYTYETEGCELADTHGDYARVQRGIADRLGVAFVDATALTSDYLRSLGPEKSKALFMWIPAGKYRFCPEGKTDNTHLNIDGADKIATLLLDGIVKAEPSLAAYRKRDVDWRRGDTLSIYIAGGDKPVVDTAAEILARDLKAVLGSPLTPAACRDSADIAVDIAADSGIPFQGFDICVDRGRVYIRASDSHGAAYGLLEISRLAGVSPWEWWADVVPVAQERIVIPAYYHQSSHPSVEYRGIFINDEDWGLMPWSHLTHDPAPAGVVGPATTARIFELLLRLRANTYWPPMHECTVPFFLTDGNRDVARKYGIYIGGSHCEPMGCNIAGEWPRRGRGEYDYTTNADFIRQYWAERVHQTKDQEIIYTLGMRGVHDGAMQGADDASGRKALLERVIGDQRAILARAYGKDAGDVPQVFIPYKEVLDAYNAGLDVPGDVTLMWCDDNYGYIRHFPTAAEAARRGGNGVYYHVSYWGRPHDYLWLGTFSPGLLYSQMSLAYDKGVRKMWILNVGDIKPAEYQIELFMDMAWDIDAVRHSGVEKHMHSFYARTFGDAVADTIAGAMKEHYRLSFIRKPEFLGNTRCEEYGTDYWSVVRDLPWTDRECEERIDAYDSAAASVEAAAAEVADIHRDAYFQLVGYPVLAASQMNKKLLYAQLARHGRCAWQMSHQAYDSIAALTARYNRGYDGSGKWMHMMDFRPRMQPVFDRVPERYEAPAAGDRARVLRVIDGADLAGDVAPCELLGYAGRAAAIGESASVDLDLAAPTGIDLEFCMLPTHPVDDGRVAFDVHLDGKLIARVDYQTEGRSEEWKRNVLGNRAVRRVALSSVGAGSHRLTLTPLSQGIVLDQINVCEAAQSD